MATTHGLMPLNPNAMTGNSGSAMMSGSLSNISPIMPSSPSCPGGFSSSNCGTNATASATAMPSASQQQLLDTSVASSSKSSNNASANATKVKRRVNNPYAKAAATAASTNSSRNSSMAASSAENSAPQTPNANTSFHGFDSAMMMAAAGGNSNGADNFALPPSSYAANKVSSASSAAAMSFAPESNVTSSSSAPAHMQFGGGYASAAGSNNGIPVGVEPQAQPFYAALSNFAAQASSTVPNNNNSNGMMAMMAPNNYGNDQGYGMMPMMGGGNGYGSMMYDNNGAMMGMMPQQMQQQHYGGGNNNSRRNGNNNRQQQHYGYGASSSSSASSSSNPSPMMYMPQQHQQQQDMMAMMMAGANNSNNGGYNGMYGASSSSSSAMMMMGGAGAGAVVYSQQSATEQYEQMRGQLAAHACTAKGRHVLSSVIRMLQPEQLDAVIAELIPAWGQLIADMNGCHVARTYVETVPGEKVAALATALSRDTVLAMCALSQHSRRIVQSMFEAHDPKYMQGIVDIVASGAVALATTQQGCISVMRILEHCSVPQRAQLMGVLAPHLAALAMDPYGNYVVQTVTTALPREEVSSTLEAAFEDSWVPLSCNKFASNVMEKLIRLASPRTRGVIVRELCECQPNLAVIIVDGFGNFVLQALIDSCVSPIEFRHIAERVRPMLASSPYGHKIEGKLKSKRFNGANAGMPMPASFQHQHQQHSSGSSDCDA